MGRMALVATARKSVWENFYSVLLKMLTLSIFYSPLSVVMERISHICPEKPNEINR